MKELYIGCELMIPDKMLKEIRKDVIKQRADGVVILPAGFKLLNIDIDLLIQIKTELLDESKLTIQDKMFVEWEDIERIINKHIAELKEGETDAD